MSLSFDLLRTFLAVHRSGSVTRAAELLGVSQPTVTAQVKVLEEALERPLFERLPRGMAPTPAADQLARRISGPLDSLEELVLGDLSGPAEAFGRAVHLGGPAEIMCARVLPAIAPMIADGLQARVTLGMPDDLLAALADGRVDLVVSTVRPRRGGLRVDPLCDEEFVLVAAPEWAEKLLPRAPDLPARASESPGRASGLLAGASGLPVRAPDLPGRTSEPPTPAAPVRSGRGPGPAPVPSGQGRGSGTARSSRGRGSESMPSGRGRGVGGVRAGVGRGRDGVVGGWGEVLGGVPLVAYAENLPILRRYWRSVLGVRLSRAPALVVPDLRGVLAAVVAGAGVSVLPRYLCADELADGRLRALMEPEVSPLNTLFLVSRAGAPHPAAAAVQRHLLEVGIAW